MSNFTMEFTGNQSRNKSEIQDSPKSTGSIEVGVIIMGMSCVCVVACALIILQVRSLNRQRQRRRRQRSSTVSIMMDGEDPYQSFAPPTYEAVIRSPHLYPPSPRSSVASVISISSMRRGSSTSNLSKVSAMINSYSQGRDSSTFSSATQDQSTSCITIEDLEDPPPPYPGIIASTYADLDIHIHSRTNAACNQRDSCHSNSEERNEIRNTTNVDETTESQINSDNLQTLINSNNIPANSSRNRSSSHGNDIQLSNNSYHRNSVHNMGGNHSNSVDKSRGQSGSRGSLSGQNSSSCGRARSVSVVCSSNFLMPSQAWEHYPRELSFVNCQSTSQTFGNNPSHNS
ncbi:homeobox protein 3-like [Actinia tenebrosa]|uniref:Homeobox protein 3-like n=1 Tax=Actinia tenebrosa TaxID=6105 RepID=A0A6P8I4H3_ACTTE|nr:homeobox protein 3-like [Actinia tenebrosa]XP_031562795.1 homeobox protein 3-like [Actinia tenebrosa]XP_031562796.1 homeobox protein 3-like [Actinia tenebrosa]